MMMEVEMTARTERRNGANRLGWREMERKRNSREELWGSAIHH